MVLNLTDTSNAVIACLEITDHAGCVEDHSGGLACKRAEYPFGEWAGDGLYAEDSTNVQLSNLNIHGLANTGIRAGRLNNWLVENVQITANGWAGWDGDIEGEDANTGTMVFKSVDISWNGCGESWPEVEPQGCWSQTAGGYGDGFGTGNTGGDWIFEDSVIAHNTSDGLDLLYHTLDGKITLNRVRVEGNAGNQVKSTGPTTISNSVLVGNCGYFDGKPFTYAVDSCRALGNTLALFFKGGEASSIFSTTLYGQGDGLVFGAPHENFSCTGDEALTARNNIFLGDKDFFDFEDQTFLFYQEGCPGLLLNSDYDLFYGVKDMSCGHSGQFMSSGSHDLCQDPQFTGPLTGDHFGLMLSSGSPGINAGNFAHASGTDILGNARDAFPDLGAYEWQPD